MQRSVEIEQTILRNNKLGDLCVTSDVLQWLESSLFQISGQYADWQAEQRIKIFNEKEFILGLFKGKVSNI